MQDAMDGPLERDVTLNQECFCITLDETRLAQAIVEESHGEDVAPDLLAARPHLFSRSPVFIAQADLTAMLEVVASIEAVADLASYQEAALAWAPQIARRDFGPRGAFMGYDFHVGNDGPKLIEVNTNAGGAFLNAFLARAQTACCQETQMRPPAADFDEAVWRMFLSEWRLQGRSSEPRSIAIVDDSPEGQYLYPEFLLARRLFERRGITAWVLDPAELHFSRGRLLHQEVEVDLVYNRLVDFGLEGEGHQALRQAYSEGAAVVTPGPRNHALLADKRNLTLLSDPERLRRWGVSAEVRARLSAIPRTILVTTGNADELWASRKEFFFKPAGGHAGKAVYRGDKLTQRVWSDIQEGDYIAQRLAAPRERRVKVDGEVRSMKLDVRLYTYRSELLLAAARVYQGQTTNFRTPGGGFAPVFLV